MTLAGNKKSLNSSATIKPIAAAIGRVVLGSGRRGGAIGFIVAGLFRLFFCCQPSLVKTVLSQMKVLIAEMTVDTLNHGDACACHPGHGQYVGSGHQ